MLKKEKCIIARFGILSLCLALLGNIVCRKEIKEGIINVISSNSWGLSFQEEGEAPMVDVDHDKLRKLDAYYFTTGVIKGVYIDEDIKVDINKILMILNMFNLSLLCYNDSYDYDKICCYNNCNKVINN